MGSSSAIEFSFGFNVAQLQSGAEKAQAIVARAMGRIQQTSALALGAAAGIAQEAFEKMAEAGREAAEKIEGVFEQGAGLEALHKRTDIATGRLYMFSVAMKECDVDSAKLAPSINRLQLKLAAAAQGGKVAALGFKDIGLSVKDLLTMSPDKQFTTVATAIAGLADPTARAAAAMQIFGRSGAELLPLFNNSDAVATMSGNLSASATLFEQNAEKFHQAAVALQKVGLAFAGFYQGMAAGLVDSFNDALTKAGAVDFIEKGRSVGAAIGAVAHWIMAAFDGVHRALDLGRSVMAAMVGLSLEIAEGLWHGIQAAGDLFKSAWYAVLSVSETIVAELLDLPAQLGVSMLSALEFAFGKAREIFGGGMLDVIANISAAFHFSMYKAMQGIFAVLPAKLKKMLGVHELPKDKSFEQFQLEAKARLAPYKGYQAEDYDSIHARNSQAYQNTGYGQVVKAISDAAGQNSQKAADALRQAGEDWHSKQGFTGMADPKIWFANAVDFYKKAVAPAAVAAHAATKAAAADPWARFKGWQTFGGTGGLTTGGLTTGGLNNLHDGLGGSGSAYGHVRRGDAARRRQEAAAETKAKEKEAAAKAGKEAALADGVDGTNDRLDKMISIFDGQGGS